MLATGAAGCSGGEADECASLQPIAVEPWAGGSVDETAFTCSHAFVLCPSAYSYAARRPACDGPEQLRVVFTVAADSPDRFHLRLDLGDDGTVTGASAVYLSGPVANLPTGGRVSIEGDRLVDLEGGPGGDCVRGRLEVEFDSLMVAGEFVTEGCGAGPLHGAGGVEAQ